jgi:hypothetical protein
VLTNVGHGPADEHQDDRQDRPLQGNAAELRGKHQEAQDDEHRHLGYDRQPIMEDGHGTLRRQWECSQPEPGQVDREEARPMQAAGGAEGDCRCAHRPDHIARFAPEPCSAQSPHREPARRHTDHDANPKLADEQERHVRGAVVGELYPVDQPNDEQNRHRVVEARLSLQGPRDPRP